jgi:hyperosmotically inducible protein
MRMQMRTLGVAGAFAAAALAGCDQADQKQVSQQVREQSAVVAKAVDDSAITAKVKTALLAEPGIPSADISVETVAGTVTLTGKVTDRAQAERAIQVVAMVEGVKGVDNRLAVN